MYYAQAAAWLGLSDFCMEINVRLLRNYTIANNYEFLTSRANCRFCSRYVAPLVIYKPTHIKGATQIDIANNDSIHQIAQHTALLPIVWFTHISWSLIGIWTQKLHKIVHLLLTYAFFLLLFFSDFQVFFLSFLHKYSIHEFWTDKSVCLCLIAADYEAYILYIH